jgi:hypothetical protein
MLLILREPYDSPTESITVIKFGLSNREYVLLHDDAT